MAPTVSIVLPTYNGERFLAEAIRSCLSQTFQDFELIVVVDGSTDGTEAVLARFHDPRMRVISKANGGLPRALNTGFADAKGELLTWTSDDNVFLPTAIADMVRELRGHSSAPMVSCDYFLIDDAGERVGYDRRHVACFLYRADVAHRVGEYRADFPLVEDADYWVRIEAVGGPMRRLRRPLYEYRVHGGSLSAKRAGERAFIEAKMYVDLATRGIYRGNVELRLLDCVRQAALYRQWDSIAKIRALAREHHLPCSERLDRVARLLETRSGWWVGRTVTFAYGRSLKVLDLAMRVAEGTLRA